MAALSPRLFRWKTRRWQCYAAMDYRTHMSYFSIFWFVFLTCSIMYRMIPIMWTFQELPSIFQLLDLQEMTSYFQENSFYCKKVVDFNPNHYSLYNDTHMDGSNAFLSIFMNLLVLTGNDVIIPGKLILLLENSLF